MLAGQGDLGWDNPGSPFASVNSDDFDVDLFDVISRYELRAEALQQSITDEGKLEVALYALALEMMQEAPSAPDEEAAIEFARVNRPYYPIMVSFWECER